MSWIMARPHTNNGDAAREALQMMDKWLSDVVDIVSTELNNRQRYQLRLKIIRYQMIGERCRDKDPMVHECFVEIVTTYINPYETL